MAKLNIFVVVKHDATPDGKLADFIEKSLLDEGLSVHVDRQAEMNVAWAEEVRGKIHEADVVISLISGDSIQSEFFTYELEIAHGRAQENNHRPAILPVQLAYNEELPEPIAGYTADNPAIQWGSEADNERIIQELKEKLNSLPEPAPETKLQVRKGLRLAPRSASPRKPIRVSLDSAKATSEIPKTLEPVGGAVPLHSEFYIERNADKELRKSLVELDSIVLIKGARQVGKTSLLARGLQQARERGALVALTDFQKFNASNLSDITAFLITLAETLVDQLEIDIIPADYWDERRGPSVNFEKFIRQHVLKGLNRPLVWGLDEVDRLFSCPFGSEVFGLFRSWHNERALDPSAPWAGLTLVIAYATEAHLFITDMNQSPFNVGTRLTLEEFSKEQVTELNRLYRSPLSSSEEIDLFMEIVAGHPFLVRRGLHEMATKKLSVGEFLEVAAKPDGIYGDHLRRILVLIAKDEELSKVLQGIVQGKPCPTMESFYRLRSAGILVGESQSEAKLRCELYTKFLAKYLVTD